MQNIPDYVIYLFYFTVILSILWFYRASHFRMFLYVAFLWVVIQFWIARSGFYQVTDVLPPRILLTGVLPAILAIVVLFATGRGKAFIDQIDLRILTAFHSIRILVEVVLLLLYRAGAMSVFITFEGTNFDLFSGITAPLMVFIAFKKDGIRKNLLLWWNVLCLLLLLNVVITAIFSIPGPLQKLAFDQPNIAVLHFPYVLLPSLIVPLVLFAHLVAIRRLISKA